MAAKVTLIYSLLKTFRSMNKKVRTVLQVISYIITLLLGGAGASMM